MDLDRALAFSRYAHGVFAAAPELRDEIVASLDAPFDWNSAQQALDTGLFAHSATTFLGATPPRVCFRRCMVS